jgi:hypothetical protein
MAITQLNPHLAKYQEAILKGDENEIEVCEELWRNYNTELISKANIEVEHVERKLQTIKKLPSVRKQYKEACELYKYVVHKLVPNLRELKKECRVKLGIGKEDDQNGEENGEETRTENQIGDN